MKKFLFLVTALFLAGEAFADSCATALMPAFTAGQATSLCKNLGTAINHALVPSTDNTYALGSLTKQWSTVYANNVVVQPFAPTLAATPVAATNQFAPGLNVVPTIAANSAAFIGPATPVPGQQFTIHNVGTNAIRAKAAGGATLNGATAGGYISIASLATVECKTVSATNQICEQPVIPTPAGP